MTTATTSRQRAQDLVARMTEDEKFAWLSGPMAIPLTDELKAQGAIGSAAFYPGIPPLGIPAMQQADASLGISNIGDVRPGDHATGLPSSLLLGATFNRQLAHDSGALVGREAKAKGFNVQLAGGANLIREPRGGRNFEHISEDPLLTGELAGHSVAGIQAQGVVSTVKHFVANGQETGRVMVSANLAEAALRESDLLAFQIAIAIGKPGAVMPGYNLVNGHYASENAFLLQQVLKDEWGCAGWVMSDWGATHSTVKAALAGLDVQSGANLDDAHYFGQALRNAVRDGQVPQSRIDDMVARILTSLIDVGALDAESIDDHTQPIDFSHHKLIAQRQAEEGIVLLTNRNATLPLPQRLTKLLIVGAHADHGVLCGGGSSAVTPIGSLQLPGTSIMGMDVAKVVQPSSLVTAIKEESVARDVVFVDGTDRQQVLDEAGSADAVIVFAQEWRSEGLDAVGLALPDDQDALIEAIAGVNPKTIVVIQSGGPVTMPWRDSVAAILAAWYPGSGGGPAVAGVLFGRVNPSGRLPVTFPASEAQLPRPEQIDPETTTSNPGTPRKGGIIALDYDIDGSDVGYRWFAREGHQPLFPFGFGLSYTTFEMIGLRVGVDGRYIASVEVANTGARTGAVVVQIYVEKQGPDGFVKRLAGFTKTTLAAGERASVEIDLEPRILARYRVGGDAPGFAIEPGVYRVWAAQHVGDDALWQDVAIDEARRIGS
ncbi:beta-glucosidase [Massilia aurea]|uniref:Beta-glucosidase n=1 Tax=Massilia aurea TaxID=373040 RepID=A0A7W9WY89_9BURK|nr:glycoside hydrolase family 3 C-terminal domain-containing protein [Massilia aurea]MBB6133057.1 beta-glucosidase [Massilia aurea]